MIYTFLAVRRFVRYVAVGVSTFVFDLAMLYLAVSVFAIPYYIAIPLAFLVAISCNYALSRMLVFTGTERTWHGGYAYFALIALGGAGATTGLVAGLVTLFGLHYLSSRVIVAGVVGIVNYLFNLYLNFKVVGKHVME